jgi:cob(I)alamin adenosyltransferase
MSMKIYTKTGDKGTTSLIGGVKVSKANLRIEAYGTVDELNSWIGYIRDSLQHKHAGKILKEIQDRLFIVGSSLACAPDKKTKIMIPDLHEDDIGLLEKEIDKMDQKIKPLKTFILPGGHPYISMIHIARCVCRRAERVSVALTENKEPVEPVILKYLNRLSDYLFTLARITAAKMKVKEIPWKPREN